MVNSIPNEYIIFDNRGYKEFVKVSFSKYLIVDVLKALQKSLINCKIEESINWAVELLISGHTNKFWEKVLNIGIKNININNPNFAYFIYKKYSRYLDLLKKYSLIELRNNQSYRNMLAEICFTVCNSLKTKSLGFMKIKESDFNMLYLESKMIANNPNIISDKIKFGDPNETKIILNEFNYCLINKKYDMCVYWLSWIFEWEKKNTKKDKMYVCGYREIQNIDKKYYNDLIWLVWEIILKEGMKHNNDLLNDSIQSLYKLYKYDYKSSNKSKKAYIILYSIKYFTDSYHITNGISNYHLMIQSCLNINYLFFEKNKLSVNNLLQKEIYKFKNSKNERETEIKNKEIKENKNIEKKNLLELKKKADLKMKFKISKVEEIDTLILKNNIVN